MLKTSETRDRGGSHRPAQGNRACGRRDGTTILAALALLACFLVVNLVSTLWLIRTSAAGSALRSGGGMALIGTVSCSLAALLLVANRLLRDQWRRRESEQALSLQDDRWQTTLASIGDGVIVTDDRQRVTYLNPVAEALCGWASSEAAGKPLSEIFPLRDEQTRRPVEDPVARVLSEGAVICLASHTCLVARDGTVRPVNDSAAPIRDALGTIKGVVLVFRDDSERRHQERALIDAARRKDEFLAMLAHELRNPLAAMSSALDVIRLPRSESRREWSRDVMERQVNHLSHLIDDLLDISRFTCDTMQLNIECVDVKPIARRAVESVRYLLDLRKHRFHFSLADAPLAVSADPFRLEQILVNLLTNAIKYTDIGGRVALEVDLDGRDVCFRVTDNGIGITPALLPHIFDMFRQGKRSLARTEGGLGLGLSIVKKLTEAFGGTISAHSGGPGQGSEFELRLPAVALDAAQVRKHTSNPSAAAESGLSVLIIDDNEDLATGLASVLELHGHDVRVSHDGESGFAAAVAVKPDVVLLDIGLPILDGYEVARRLRAAWGDAPARIIAISGYGLEDDRRRSIEAGINHHLTKPIDIRELAELLAAG